MTENKKNSTAIKVYDVQIVFEHFLPFIKRYLSGQQIENKIYETLANVMKNKD